MNRTELFRGAGLALLFLSVSGGVAEAQPILQSSTFLGGSGDQSGTGIAVGSDGVYLSGTAGFLHSIAAKYTLVPGATPVWNISWPGSNSSAEAFQGVAWTPGGVYYSGLSFSQTSDNIGSKEQKGVYVKFPLNGATGPSTGGAAWVSKPSFFPSYQGYEQLIATTSSVEAGNTFLYASGTAQSGGANNTTVLVKYNTAGTEQWKAIVGDPGFNQNSGGPGIAVLNNNVYVAGSQGTAIGPDAKLWKYNSAGNIVWTKTVSATGGIAANAVYGAGNALYVTGTMFTGGLGGSDVFITKYDEAGNQIWTQTWGGAANEDGNGITLSNNKLYVVGDTSSFGSGGKDSFLLELDPTNGSFLSDSFFGGALDDIAHGIAGFGNDLYVVGESRNFDNVAGRDDIMMLRYSTTATTPEPGSFALLVGTLSAGVLALRTHSRRKRE